MNQVADLKSRLLACIASVNRSGNEHNARIVNRMAAELLALSGEVLSCGQFVKVA